MLSELNHLVIKSHSQEYRKLADIESTLKRWIGGWKNSRGFQWDLNTYAEKRSNNEWAIRIKLFTNDHVYSVVADTGGYLGCVVSTRKPRTGEDWTRGSDLADGRFNYKTWVNILGDIVSYELQKPVRPVFLKRTDIDHGVPEDPEVGESFWRIEKQIGVELGMLMEKEGEYKIPHLKKGMKSVTTTIPPERRTFKNRPKYSTGKSMVSFQNWLLIKSQDNCYGKSEATGEWWGWSHRACHGFKVGTKIKDGFAGRQYYGKKTPFTIKSDEEAKKVAIAFARSIS